VSYPRVPAEEAAESVTTWLSGLSTGPAQQIGELTLIPLIHPKVPSRPDILIEEAMSAGQLEIIERDGGTVQQVLARNGGMTDVLVLEGDTLVGCKQNRMVAWSVLVGSGSTVPVSVGCMERGRWSRGGPAFKAGTMSVDPHIRRRSKRETSASALSPTGPRLDQGRAWSDVDDKLRQWNVSTESDDYHAGLLTRVAKTRARLQHVLPVPGQIGVMALLRQQLLGIEIVGHPETWSRLARRVLPSYALGAETAADDPDFGWTGRAAPEEWLGALARARLDLWRARGKGLDGTITSGGIRGSCLWHEGVVRHLAVFPN